MLAEIDKSRSNNVPIEELSRFLKKIVPDVTAGQLKRFSEHVDPMAVGYLPYQAVVEGMKNADPARKVTRAPTYLQVCEASPPTNSPPSCVTNHTDGPLVAC